MANGQHSCVGSEAPHGQDRPTLAKGLGLGWETGLLQERRSTGSPAVDLNPRRGHGRLNVQSGHRESGKWLPGGASTSSDAGGKAIR